MKNSKAAEVVLNMLPVRGDKAYGIEIKRSGLYQLVEFDYNAKMMSNAYYLEGPVFFEVEPFCNLAGLYKFVKEYGSCLL